MNRWEWARQYFSVHTSEWTQVLNLKGPKVIWITILAWNCGVLCDVSRGKKVNLLNFFLKNRMEGIFKFLKKYFYVMVEHNISYSYPQNLKKLLCIARTSVDIYEYYGLWMKENICIKIFLQEHGTQ